MEIHPKVSSGSVVNNLPQENTTEVTCNIMVKDGHTIVIGGMFDETASISRSQVPGLGNIPLLGPLFRSNTDASTRNEIVVLLTPHIIENIEVADEIGRQFLEDGKRHCLGLRESFACFTRERITVGYLMEADRAWTKYQETGKTGDLDWALWNVNLALGVGPNNLKAIRLKDRILSEKTGRAVPTAELDDLEQPRRPAAPVRPGQGGRAGRTGTTSGLPAETPKAASVETPKAASAETPKAASAETPKVAPVETPKAVSSAAPAAPAVPQPPHAALSTPWPVAMIAVAPPAAPEPTAAPAPAAAPETAEGPAPGPCRMKNRYEDRASCCQRPRPASCWPSAAPVRA